jgi:F-type H+-transporting ATPase subunit b
METETTGTVGRCVGPDGSAIGLPQICFDWWPNQIFWLVVTLVVIYLILSRIAIPRIASVLADRNGTISNDLAAAEELKEKAADAEAAYQKALADARAEAQGIAQQVRDEIKAELDKAMTEADAKIAAKAAESEATIAEIRDSAMENVEAVARDTAAALVAALGQSVDQDRIDAVVAARMKG